MLRVRCCAPILVCVLVANAFSQSAPSGLDFEKADREIIRLRPSRFPDLPAAIRQELEPRGCTVPQIAGEQKPHNAIKGSFLRPGELDWAVLCSVHRASSILIFPNASGQHAIQLGPLAADRQWLQSNSRGEAVYSRQISPVGRDYILRHYRAYGGPKPPPIDHEGIDDAFVGKASVVRYFYRGKWLQLTGAD